MQRNAVAKSNSFHKVLGSWRVAIQSNAKPIHKLNLREAPEITDQKRGNPWKNCETLRRHQQISTFRKSPEETGTMHVPESSTFKGIRWQGDDEHYYTIKLRCVTFHAVPCLSRHPTTFYSLAALSRSFIYKHLYSFAFSNFIKTRCF